MTKLKQLLLTYRTRRSQCLPQLDTVSFGSLGNDTNDQIPFAKDATFNQSSPDHSNSRVYVKFSAQNYKRVRVCPRPNILSVLLLIVILGAFLILPGYYLMQCFFGPKPDELQNHHSFALKELVHQNHDVHQENPKRVTKSKLQEPPKPDYDHCPKLDQDKYDCYPEDGVNKEKCEARGCCWAPKQSDILENPLNTPYCFYPNNFNGYKFVNITETDFGLVAFLKRKFQSPYPKDISLIKMIVKYETEDRVHFRIVDPLAVRFEPPYPYMPVVDKAPTNLSYSFICNKTASGFKILRKIDNTVIFDTMNLQTMIYSDQMLQITSKLPSNKIYGLGEHRTNLLLNVNWSKLTMFNHDGIPTENRNLYGSHAFYLNIEPSGNSHGVFLLNSNAMDVILQPTPAITYRTIGGILDFYIVLGPTPANVVQQYTEIIGRPFMPPFWSLGFHLCRFGYKTLNATRAVTQRTIDAGIPLDSQWNDLDYMKNNNDFSYDDVNYKGLPKFVKELHSKGMHYIPLIDPGISASEKPGQYAPYDLGLQMDIFVKNSSGMPFVGKVWNRASTVWPDFTNTNSVDYWKTMLDSMHKLFPFDGAWIDMNEPSNFLSGSFNGCPKSSLEAPPYLPNVDGGVINYKTLCMTANHSIGLHYDVHNLYGFVEAIVTNFALAEIRGERPFIISRSTFPGHGQYAGHWSGDVYSTWKDMKYSVPQLLNFGLFGIPMMGADICGFNGNTTASLCNRWMQLGAFYPFSRNHNTDDGIDQDPVALGSDVVKSSKKSLLIRYSLLPYLYTLFWAAHVNGDTVARPLFFEFIDDAETHSIDDQFLWGAALMIVPVLQESSTAVKPYFPAGIWYDFHSSKAFESNGTRITFDAPLDTIPLFLRGGNIIPQLEPKQTTTESRKGQLQLLVAPNAAMTGVGKLYWDDGNSLNTVEERRYTLINFNLQNNTLSSTIEHKGYDSMPKLGLIKVLGLELVSQVKINKISQKFKYNTAYKFLLIDELDVSLTNSLTVEWE